MLNVLLFLYKNCSYIMYFYPIYSYKSTVYIVLIVKENKRSFQVIIERN